MNKIKHKIKLLWLKRKWVVMSIFNTSEFKKARNYIELNKELINLYHKAKREGDKLEIARAEGRLEVIEHIKKIEKE